MADENEGFEITTSAQVERTYLVQGDSEEQAHARLRTWLKDSEMLRDGLVVELPEKQTDTTPQKVRKVKKVTRPRAVKDGEKQAEAG